jgi:hypothetical protein
MPYDGDPFFDELQEVYDEIDESRPPGATVPRPQELDDDRDEIEASGLFEVVDIKQYDWETVYDAEGYIDLLNTFSGHIAMQDWQRDRLYGEIRRRLAQRPDGHLRRHWGGVLQVARRRSARPSATATSRRWLRRSRRESSRGRRTAHEPIPPAIRTPVPWDRTGAADRSARDR